jgi:U4/U6 small nuclear ribonucleoprotein PRP31
MGASKTSTAGYSTLHIGRHVGVLYQADLISKRPIDLRTRAARMTAAKVVLAARIDRLHESTDGYMGKQFVEQINHKLDRLIEPNSLMGKNAKALPIPDEPKRKRRGGRKYRKRREELHQSELQKLKNRVAFGTVAEEDILDGDEMEGLGMAAGTMMGASTGARLRVGVMDESKKQSRKLNVSAAMARRLKVLDQAGGGTASSLAFTPVQGLELENPETKRVKLSDANNRYFNASSGFGLGLG